MHMTSREAQLKYMTFDEHSRIKTFPPFPEEDMRKYEKNYDKGIFDYSGITRSRLRGPRSTVNSEGDATDRT
jgi:hypothetical protein